MSTESQHKFIEKLAQMDGILQSILKQDQDHLVFDIEQFEQIETLAAKSRRVLDKLRSREFTVAIVGLEKAGKSTLGNALIQLDALPELPERCTFTTTEVRAGNEDKAVIEFYSYEEFNRNFQSMLKDLEFKGPAEYETFEQASFAEHWRAMQHSEDKGERGTYQLYNGTTAKDIEFVTKEENHALLMKNLGRDAKEFRGREALKSREFQKYITGIIEQRPGEAAKRAAYPYAVKKVTIYSTGLGKMRNIVLYDVPGFDSPTKLHKQQTKEKLLAADAIILVTNAGDRPNLNGPQLDMLQQGNIDEDNIELRDKAFVFGNKLDTAADADCARSNIVTLTTDAVQNHEIARENRIVCGSAKLYIDRVEAEKNGTPFHDVFDEWHFPDGNGVDRLKQKLQEYYDHDRFEVMKRRAENTLREARKLVQAIVQNYHENGDTAYLGLDGEIKMRLKDALIPFDRRAKQIYEKIRDDIVTERPFSTEICASLHEIFHDVSAEDALLVETENERTASLTTNYPVQAVEANWREKLQVTFLRNLVARVASMTQGKEQEIYEKLVDALLAEMQVPTPNDEQRAAVKELFQEALVENGEKCYFTPLVDRFIGSLLEAVIRHPYGGAERRNFFLREPANRAEMNVLATYYLLNKGEQDNFDNAANRSNLFEKILSHKHVVTEEDADTAETSGSIETTLQNFFKKNEVQMAANLACTAISILPVAKWAKILKAAGLTVKEMGPVLEALKRAVTKKPDAGKLAANSEKPDLAIHTVEETIMAICKQRLQQGREKNGTAQQNAAGGKGYLESLGVNAQATTKEEMIDAVQKDIEILRDITYHAVVAAIGLEKAFNSTMVKNVTFIRELKDLEQSDLVYAWIRKNARKLKPSAYASLERKQSQNMTRKHIVTSIEQLMEQLNA
ncbi:dynamin family protein [uncultured Selenomonas sp.]|uniref:dynamin family protein n=1 Tax=uncultured Selenomonas sp. TaxID=159275 RepID=UPI0025D1F503|nr:dynamin family protein [uncultured Selenomonas sp.]